MIGLPSTTSQQVIALSHKAITKVMCYGSNHGMHWGLAWFPVSPSHSYVTQETTTDYR